MEAFETKSSLHDVFDPLVSTFVDNSFMSNPWDDFSTVGEFACTFPTPPYEPEDRVLESMTSAESPSSSIAHSLESEDLFGELTGVNYGDLFSDTPVGDSGAINAPVVENPSSADAKESVPGDQLQAEADTELLESFVKEIDELDLDIELDDTNDLMSKKPSERTGFVKGDFDAVSNSTESSDEDTFEKDFSPRTRPARVLRQTTASRGKFGPDVAKPAIRMVKVSQYEQYTYDSKQEDSISKSQSVSKPGKLRKQPALEIENSILDCDVRKVPPGRKAAVQAKINREKKKAYIRSLEEERTGLLQENRALSLRTKRLEKERGKLAEEVAYLRRVLFNDSQLANLLKNIGNTPDVRLSSTIMSGVIPTQNKRKDIDHDDHDYVSKRRRVEAAQGSGGVCLHVDKDSVSVEFCRHCAAKSSGFEVE